MEVTIGGAHLLCAIHVNGVYLVVSLGEELDGWESLDLDILNLVGSGVHLGNHDIFRVLEVFSQLVPDGHELLAVS